MTCEDTLNRSGEWTIRTKIDKRLCYTYSGMRWVEMRRRCSPAGLQQKFRLRYEGCSYIFTSFQNFTEWMRDQVGYGQDRWHLDKDLLVKGNKIYSPETCVLLPNELNCLLLKCDKSRGPYPIGVHKPKDSTKYKAIVQLSIGEAQTYLGRYSTAEDAFAAYKYAKESHIKEMAEKWKGRIEDRAYNALLNYKVEITD